MCDVIKPKSIKQTDGIRALELEEQQKLTDYLNIKSSMNKAPLSEIKEKKWFWGGIGMQLGVGYSIAFLVFFFGTLFTTANFGSIWMPVVGWIVTLGFIGILIFLIIKKQRQFKTV